MQILTSVLPPYKVMPISVSLCEMNKTKANKRIQQQQNQQQHTKKQQQQKKNMRLNNKALFVYFYFLLCDFMWCVYCGGGLEDILYHENIRKFY